MIRADILHRAAAVLPRYKTHSFFDRYSFVGDPGDKPFSWSFERAAIQVCRKASSEEVSDE